MQIVEFCAASSPPVSALLFDLDNTLFDLESAFEACVMDFVRTQLPDLTQAEALAVAQTALHRDPAGYGSKGESFAELSRRLPAWKLGAEETKDHFRNLLLTHIRLGLLAEKLLSDLASAGLPFGIVTNGSDRQLRKVDRLDLTGRAECVLVSGILGAAKPDPRIFLAGAAQLGAEPARILFVGDNPLTDIGGAQSVGMRTCWIQRGQPWPQVDGLRPPDLTVESLA